ncbi:MAG: tRNA (guanine-N1)-methyltransferase [Desulfurococcales archaeon]|nr:tRNA (guanine-N1)-methyltransferase [Desulfurococcales archaeon]
MGLLSARNACRLGVRFPFEPRKLESYGFQYVAVEMLVREYSVWQRSYWGRPVHSCGEYSLVASRGGLTAEYAVSRDGPGNPVLEWYVLEEAVEKYRFPILDIDLSLMSKHSEDELSSLRVQLALVLAEARRYLWDRNVLLTSAPRGVEEWLYPLAGNHKMIVSESGPGEALWGLKADRVVILRPDAEEELSREDILSAQAFLIGGIVDKIPRPGLSRVLDSAVPWGEPRRITLRGSTIGVPSRLNRIAGILLKARLDYDGDLERAVIDYMARADRVNRLFYEMQRARVRRARLSSLLEEYSWLRPTVDDIMLAARKAKVEVVPDEGSRASR